MSITRRRLLDDSYKKTVDGNPAIAQGSLARMYPGLNLYGWSKQDGTPSPDNPVPIVSAGSSGEIGVAVQGGNLVDIPDIPAGDGDLNVTLPVNISVPFVVSVDDSDVVIEGAAVWRLQFKFEDGSSAYASDGAFPKTINASPENRVVSITYSDIRIVSGTYRNFMVNYGSTALPYEPYKQLQTLTVSAPGGLPGIPVTASKLPEGVEPTYTDTDGQAWVCDEVDFERGVYVRRVWKATFDGSEVWGVYGVSNVSNYGFLCSHNIPEPMNYREGFCNQLDVIVSSPLESDTNKFRFGSGANNAAIYVLHVDQYDPSLEDSGLSNWKAHLAAHPLEVMTYLTTATEEPLTAAEIAAYKALRTYSPTTTVSNDAGVWMKFKYKTRKSLEVTT